MSEFASTYIPKNPDFFVSNQKLEEIHKVIRYDILNWQKTNYPEEINPVQLPLHINFFERGFFFKQNGFEEDEFTLKRCFKCGENNWDEILILKEKIISKNLAPKESLFINCKKCRLEINPNEIMSFQKVSKFVIQLYGSRMGFEKLNHKAIENLCGCELYVYHERW